jgi:ornithine carbamoyltransferase
MKRDFITLQSYPADDIRQILALTRWLKEERPVDCRPLADKTAALIFEKPSLRTHVSFEVGIIQLGGQSVFLSGHNIGLSSRESARDAAEVLSCYNDLIVARTFSHQTVETLAAYASVPVMNALTDLLHPCQILADVYTLMELDMFSPSTKIAFIGDGNNVVNSWLELAEKMPFHFVLACPEGYEPDAQILARAMSAGVSRINIVRDPFEAAHDADVLYTDVWISMGQESESMRRKKAFKGYQINTRLLAAAHPDCVVMHCLPAHRGEEITADVLEGSRSVVLLEAENRLHVQKAIIAFLFGQRLEVRRTENELAEALA